MSKTICHANLLLDILSKPTIQNTKFIIMKILYFIIVLNLPSLLFSQQIADTTYNPIIPNPEYEFGEGPVVFIDEGHFNFHTKNGRYLAFTRLLERDGYNVQ